MYLSTGFIQSTLSGPSPGKGLSTKTVKIANNISFGDGDGDGGRDTINGTGLSAFLQHSWVQIFSPGDLANHDKLVLVEIATDTKLQVAAGTLVSAAAGSNIALVEFDVIGTIRMNMRNCVLYLYEEPLASSADLAAPGTPLVKITRDGGAFTAGQPANGLNFGDYLNGELRKAINPETGLVEVWRGSPLRTGIANSYMLCANDGITAASASARRMTGRVGSDDGADLVLTGGTTVTLGTPVDVQTVRMQLRAGVFLET